MTADKMHPQTLGSAAKSLGLAVVLVGMAGSLAACNGDSVSSDGGASVAASGSVVAEDGESVPETPNAALETIGNLSINGRSYELVRAFWCETHSGTEDGTTVVIQVGAFHEDDRLITVMGTQVDRDRDRPAVQTLSASEPGTQSHYQSGDVALETGTEPVLAVDDGQVRIQGEVISGGDIVPLEAEFALPEEPGLALHC